VRIVHLGLGAFFRAHSAWYTHAVAGEDPWGIAAFAGRGAGLAARLAAQDGCYTLIERGPEADRTETVTSVVAAYAGGDLAALARTLADPATALVTLTVTEAGYRRGGDGRLDVGDPHVQADLAALGGGAGQPQTAPGRLVAGLAARWRAGAGPLAVVPCDNLPANGPALRTVTLDMARPLEATFRVWVEKEVSFVSTVVDRITPATTPADVEEATRSSGCLDRVPVVAEPFHEWVLSGAFPAGRPPWEQAGAAFVDDVGPFERRKLWFLNGGHSLLAYVGLLRHHQTVASAFGDPVCRDTLERWWDEAEGVLGAEGTDRYRAALRERFANGRIAHSLNQIARDGTEKLAVRILPVMHAAHHAGRQAPAGAEVLAAWAAWVAGAGSHLVDPKAAVLRRAAGDVGSLLAVLGAHGAIEAEVRTVQNRFPLS